MELIKRAFKDRTIGFYIGLGAAAIAFVSSIIFIITAFNDRTFSVITFVFLLLAVVSESIVIFTDFKFASAVPVVFYAVALGMHFRNAMFPIADQIAGVPFLGGNIVIAISFAIIFSVVAVSAVVSCFMKQRKSVE